MIIFSTITIRTITFFSCFSTASAFSTITTTTAATITISTFTIVVFLFEWFLFFFHTLFGFFVDTTAIAWTFAGTTAITVRTIALLSFKTNYFALCINYTTIIITNFWFFSNLLLTAGFLLFNTFFGFFINTTTFTLAFTGATTITIGTFTFLTF